MGFAEHDEVVERFATDRSDEPLNVAVLPRRAWCGRVISDPHCTNAAGVRRTERAVAVANQMIGASSQGKASVTCPAIHWAVGLVVTLIVTSRRRA